MMEADFEADFESLFDESDFEYDESGESDESVFSDLSRRMRPGLKLPPRGNTTVRAAKPGYASRAELQATANRLDGRIATNATAIKTLDGRSRVTERGLNSVGAAVKKEIALRKKETGDLRKGLDESRQIAMIMPLLGGGNDSFSKMLPLLMYGGMMGGSGGSGGGGDNNMMMTMMMLIALGK